jgi:hypothetical protein
MSDKWPKAKTPELEARREQGESIKSIADSLGVSEQMASYHLKHVKPLDDMIDMLPDYPSELLQIPDRPCALTADWHAPYYSKKWLKRLLAVSKVLGVKDLAIVGDLTDFSWISRYLRKDGRGGGLSNDLDVTLTLLDRLLLNYEHVWWIYGNHEDRLPAALHGQDPLMTVVRHGTRHGNGELHMSAARTMLLGNDWRLEHPKTFSRDAAKVAAKAGAIFHKNIACGHAHHFGFSYDVSGNYIGIDLGGLFDVNKQEYLYNTGVTDLPAWVPGFWVYSGGKVRPFEDAFINWEDFNVE